MKMIDEKARPHKSLWYSVGGPLNLRIRIPLVYVFYQNILECVYDFNKDVIAYEIIVTGGAWLHLGR